MRNHAIALVVVVIVTCALSSTASAKHSAGNSKNATNNGDPAVAPPIAASRLPDAAPVNPTQLTVQVLNRLTFGPRPGDIETVRRMGIDAFIQQQLHPENIPEAAIVSQFISDSRPLAETPDQLFRDYGPPAINAAKQQEQLGDGPDDKKRLNKIKAQLNNNVTRAVVDAKLLRAVESPRQLQEVMTDFWFNHFNVFAKKGQDQQWIGAYEEQAIRPYALGRFRDLLGATCHHAAMLFYLDNWQNTAAGAGKGRFSGINENYARELMELHTLGVDGGYTQKDVTELARVLTGLGLPKRNNQDGTLRSDSNAFGSYFDYKRHDSGDKVILGHVIHASGEAEIEQALDLLALHPATAHHISYQLAQYFVCDDPPKRLVDKLSAEFLHTNGDINAVLNELFHSPEFQNPQYAESKFKSPFRYVVSSLRLLDAHPGDYLKLEQYLREQGMPLYECLTPDGYKNVRLAWLNPDALIRRANFVTTLTSGKFKGVVPPKSNYEQLEGAMGPVLSKDSQDAITHAPDSLKDSLVLGSPEFMQY